MNANKKIIMVVDDDQKIKDLLVHFLKEKYIVSSEENGKDAWDILGDPKLEIVPNLLITDIQMPKMDGRELTKRVKEIFPNLPVIVMTGLLDKGSVATVPINPTNGEANVYLGKPFSLVFLDRIIRELLNLP